ncbi:hypothetical protein H5410_022643 [Solanum commersonii]|uniref:Uncharacterized protein n=1 Tax=Solanum commersonii TaxID=4109 RepID=A0A9J5ZFD6_SOLCO|nr:hypothetical protein H5410_022643 [Solanum commersonii]
MLPITTSKDDLMIFESGSSQECKLARHTKHDWNTNIVEMNQICCLFSVQIRRGLEIANAFVRFVNHVSDKEAEKQANVKWEIFSTMWEMMEMLKRDSWRLSDFMGKVVLLFK